MQGSSHPRVLACGLAAVFVSGAALAQPSLGLAAPGAAFSAPKLSPPSGATVNTRTFPNSKEIGPITITPPSEDDNNRLIVDVNTKPVDINLYAGATRVATKVGVNWQYTPIGPIPDNPITPTDQTHIVHMDTQPADVNVFDGSKRTAAKAAVNIPH